MDPENNEIVEKKERRGRKKKNKEVEVKIKKKRGRKASSQFYSSVIRKKLPNLLEQVVEEENNLEEEKNIILHLDVNEETEQETPSWSEYNTDNNLEQLIITKNSTENTSIEPDKPLVNILKSFDKDVWPEKTDLKCWWCCHNFDTVPLGIPMKYYNETFYLKGCFCSFNCVLAYVIDNKHFKYEQVYPNIKSLRAKLTKHKLDDKITPAPPRESLTVFGGDLSIEKFRTTSDDYIFKRISYPMRIITDQLEKIELVKPINKISQKDQVVINEDLINQAQVRISKNKEMKTITNTLDKFLLNF